MTSNSEIFGENILNFKYQFLNINEYNKEELYKHEDISSAIFLLDQSITRVEFYNRLQDILITFNKLTKKEMLQLKHWLLNSNSEEDYKENIENIFNANKEEVTDMTSNITKGLERLKEEGIKEGEKKGANEKAIKVAKKMLQKGNSIEEVAEITELSAEEIKNLMI